MLEITDINALPKARIPVVLTIGMFDGVHLGHQQVLKKAKSIADTKKTLLLCITFKNHPVEVLKPGTFIQPIDENRDKIKLLSKYGVDILLLLKFTKALAQKTAQEFLSMIYRNIPISDLVLGDDATIGSDQENNRANIIQAADSMNVNVYFLPEVTVEGERVSSRKIRQYLLEGNQEKAERMLGRQH